jgi:hypothetical protein
MSTGKMFSSFIKNKRLKNGVHCDQHSGDVGVHAWQDKKRVIMIFTNRRDEMLQSK